MTDDHRIGVSMETWVSMVKSGSHSYEVPMVRCGSMVIWGFHGNMGFP